MPRKSNEKRSVVAVVGRPPGLNIVFDEDADDIYIMMQCLFVCHEK